MKASDLFVKALENEGVDHVFTVPGEEILDLLDSIRKSKKIKLVVLRHEQGAGFMAATYGRLTSKAGVCLVTLGPGVTNLMTSIAYAQLGGMPMVVISGQKSIKKHMQGEFQLLDIVSLMCKVTKMSKQIVNSNMIPALVRKSFHLAEEEKPGVVHIELPEDIAKESSQYKLFEVHKLEPPYADEVVLRQATKMINEAKHPLLMVGASANKPKISISLQKFVDKLKIPFFSTQMGKGSINEQSKIFLGTAALSEGDFLHRAINKADLIINVGYDIVEKPPFLMSDNKAKVIHINFVSAQIDETYFPQLEIVGDICHTIDELRKRISYNHNWEFNIFLRFQKEFIIQKRQIEKDQSFPFSLPIIVKTVQELLSKNAIISLDNGLYKIWFARNFVSTHSHGLLLDNALATMGAGLSSAMAAKLIYPKKEVIAICGDGGFLMNSHELEPAIRLNLNLLVFILRDNSYGMIKWKQKKMGLKNFGMDFDNPDFLKYAEAYGARGYRINSFEELYPTLKDCLKEVGVKLVDIPIDYSIKTI